MGLKPYRMNRRTAKVIALSALALLLSLLNVTVLAMEQEGDPAPREADASYEDAVDVAPWHKHYMDPGETYNVGSADKNTTVYIDNPGKYWLEGKSTHCRVVVRSGGVDLYLKDKLDLDPGIYGYVGSSTAAITIEDQGGTVRIISEKNAQIYLGGYYYAPAIRKDDHKTKLIFETEDPEHPGEIKAYRSIGSHSAAIGSVYRLVARNGYPGNIEFKSGIIIATGGNDSAGIGCGSGDNMVKDLVFSGAHVIATGYGYGAGIGGGLSGAVDRITISGGRVDATGDLGAGIGGGKTTNSYSGHCGTITITGGEINATSNHASGIGNGIEGSIQHIVITGGSIKASSTGKSSAGAGIGGTGSNFYGRCAQIDISGGTIVATGGPLGGVGIGSALSGESGDTTINISGGFIEAYGGKNGTSIGGGGKGAIQDNGHCYVNISGGTILCMPFMDGSIKSGYPMTCTITGGSLRCLPSDIGCTPTDGRGNPVTLMNVDLMGCPQHTRVTDASITAPSENYGMNDIVTMDGEPDKWSVVYPWLPLTTVTTEMTAAGIHYYGVAETSEGQGELWPSTQLILDANVSSSVETGVKNGSASAVKDSTSAREVSHAVRPGYTLTGYVQMRSSAKILLNTDCTFGPDVTDYTDANGKWLRQGGTATLYALWKANTFTVHFDGNKPSSASTEISGSMADQSFTYGQTQFLSPSGFTLPGYVFTGWNTKADGSGTALDDMTDGSTLCTEPSGTVILYAMWKPITYKVSFNGNGGAGSMPEQTFTFDQSQALTPNAFTNGSQVFCGWERSDLIGVRYSDGQTVENLAFVQDAEIPLSAIWSVSGINLIGITLNDIPNPYCTIKLKASSSDTEYTGMFTYESDPNSGFYGYYVCDNSSGKLLPPDKYGVFINGCDTKKTIDLSGTGAFVSFSLYTVDVTAGDHISSAVKTNTSAPYGPVTLKETGTKEVEGWPAGSRFGLQADVGSGYAFNVWQSPGVDPDFIEEKTAKSNPSAISIKGKTVMHAEARPVGYAVRFDANVPGSASTTVTGQMEDQAFVYGTAQDLAPCAYTLEGYLFKGWNTQRDMSGTSFSDGASVIDLTDIEGATVLLFAEWEPVTYTVVFNSNFGTGMMPAQRLTFDVPEALMKNQFGKADWYFNGWNLNIGGTDRAFRDGEEVVNLASVQDARVTLYAQWTQMLVYGPSDTEAFTGEKATFRVTALGGDALRYQWQIDRGSGWEDISGATKPSYTTAPVKPGNNGYLYRCIVSGDGSSVTSRAAVLTVIEVPPTGDGNRPFLWSGLALAAGIGLVSTARRRKTDAE